MVRCFAALFAIASLTGCAHSAASAPPVERIIGGKRQAGRFVSPHAYEWYVRGELAFAKGNYPLAADAFALARTGSGDDAYLAGRLAEALDRSGEERAADGVLRAALRDAPEAEALWLARGRIAERRGDANAALQAYARAERCAPRSEAGPLALSRLLHARGASARALHVLERFARRADGGSAGAARVRVELALARGDLGAAVDAVHAWLTLAPARADEVRRVARLALAKGEPETAVRLLERIPPEEGDARLRFEAYVAAGRTEAAEGLLARTEPEAWGGYAPLAELYLRAGYLAEAEELAEAAVALSNGPEAWLAAGRVKLALAKWSEAATYLARIPPDVPAFVDGRLGLTLALDALGLTGLATEVLEEAATTATGDVVPLRIQLSERHRSRGDDEVARDLLEVPGAEDDARLQAARDRLRDRVDAAGESRR